MRFFSKNVLTFLLLRVESKAVRSEKKGEPNRSANRLSSVRTEPRISANNIKKFNLIKSRELNQ
jgi:hypothetical protein